MAPAWVGLTPQRGNATTWCSAIHVAAAAASAGWPATANACAAAPVLLALTPRYGSSMPPLTWVVLRYATPASIAVWTRVFHDQVASAWTAHEVMSGLLVPS